MENRQDNFTAMGGFELPSKGLIYNPQISSHIELRSMTARDEMKRLNPSTTPYKTLADIIENCMIEKPGMSVYDMALGDYEFLLHQLRIVTYSDLYKMEIGCPYCKQVFDTEVSLDSLDKVDFDFDKFEEYRHLILPKSKKAVVIKYQTPRILDEIELKTKEMKRKYSTAEIDFETMVTLQESIESVDNEHLNMAKLETFINTLPALDMTKILNNITSMNKMIGINNEFFVTCPKCSNEIKSFFRFGPEFFRPTNV